MKRFSTIIIIITVFTAKSQSITPTYPYKPPIPPPLECQPLRKITVNNSPWIPDLYYLQKNGDIDKQLCAASVISDRVAITRAECAPMRDDKKRMQYHLRPKGSISGDDLRLVINSRVNKVYDLALLYVDRPMCVDKVCWPPKREFYEWSHCFVVGNHRIPDNEDNDDKEEDGKPRVGLVEPEVVEEDETALPCEIHYNNNLRSGMPNSVVEWYHYPSTEKIIHVKGNERVGTCTVSSGSPMMCTIKGKPNHYFQAGVVVNRTIVQAEDKCSDIPMQYLCNTGNFEQIVQSCRIDYNTTVDLCNGFDISNTGQEEVRNWINETVEKWRKSEGPFAWKPLCNSGAVDVQYDESNEAHEFPWMAAIFHSKENCTSRTSQGSFVCAATVIHPRMAMTRLKCVQKFDVTQLYLLTGVRNLDQVREYGSNRECDRRHNLLGHQEMSGDEDFKRDIVIIYWKKPIEGVVFPRLAQRGEHFHNTKCLTLGWGLYSRDPEDVEPTYQATLKKAEVPTYDNHKCYRKLTRSVKPNLTTDHLNGFICAGGEHPTDVCLVDQGGPLICQGDNHTLVLVGVMSYALGCSHDNTPNVYTSVQYHIEKIKRMMTDANSPFYSNNTENNEVKRW